MATVLAIAAHPASSQPSYSMTLLNRFLAAYGRAHPGDSIIRRNVSESMPYPLDAAALAITGKILAKQPLSDEEQRFASGRQQWVDEFVAADKYVFANPMYNLFLPAEMKSYLDVAMQANATYRYSDKGFPVGLLHGRKALHLQASGSVYHNPGAAPTAAALDVGDTYLRTILALMGVTDYAGVYAEGMAHDPQHAGEIAETAYRRAEQVAKTF